MTKRRVIRRKSNAALWLGVFILVAIVVCMFTGAASVIPVTEFAKNRFKATNNILFQSGIDKVEHSKTNFDQQIGKLREAIAVHDKRDERISGQPPVPPPSAAVSGLQVVVMQQAPPAPVPAARQTVTNLEDFAVLKDGSSDGVWEFQLDARQPWRTLPVSVSDGDEVEFSASGLVCGGINVGCVGPNGQDGPTKTAIVNRDEFPVGEAFAQALVARIGYGQFQAGGHKTYVVPDGTGQQPIELMDNYRMPYIALASGGFRVKITIRKK